MKRSERLKIVQSVAEHEERQECRAMGESQRNLQDALGRLEDLKGYRQTYSSQGTPKIGLRSTHWQDYHKFLNRLDQAVATQEQVVRDGQSRREVHHKRWLVKRQKMESLARVVDRYKSEESDKTQRQLEKLEDSQRVRTGPYDKEH